MAHTKSEGIPKWMRTTFIVFCCILFLLAGSFGYFSRAGLEKPKKEPDISHGERQKKGSSSNVVGVNVLGKELVGLNFGAAVTNWAAGETIVGVPGIMLSAPDPGKVWEKKIVLQPGIETEIYFPPLFTWLSYPGKTPDNKIRIQKYKLVNKEQGLFKKIGEPITVGFDENLGWENDVAVSFYHEQGGMLELNLKRRHPLDD